MANFALPDGTRSLVFRPTYRMRGSTMRTPKQEASGLHETETQERKPDEGVHATPADSATRKAKPREQGDDFSVLLHLGLL